MRTPDFLNRNEEFKLFENNIYLNASSATGRIILIYSTPGIGKARFVQEYIAKHYPNSLTLEVKIAASSSMISSPYQFINALYSKMKEVVLARRSFSIIPSIEFTLNLISLSLSVEINSDIPKDVLKKINSIRYFFRECPQNIILSFENFQIIDNESLKILQSFIRENSNLVAFFEYTTDEVHGSSHLLNLFEYFKDCSVFARPIELKKLDSELVLQIVEQSSKKEISKKEFQDYYIRYNGNIDELMICFIQNNNEITNPQNIFDEEKLSPQAIYISYILLFCRGHLFTDELLKLISSSPTDFWNEKLLMKVCYELQKYNIISIDNNEIILNNSSIRILEHSKLNATAYVAFNDVQIDCYKKLETNTVSTESLYRLIYSYYIFKDSNILNLLPYIKKHLIYSDSFYEVIKQIDEISNSISNESKIKQKLILGIVDILYSLGCMQEAEFKLETIFCKNNLLHLMYMLALKSVLKAEDFHQFYIDTRKAYKNYPEVTLFCDYINLYYKMKYAKSNEAKNYAQKILDNRKYRPYLVFYFVKKNQTTYLNNDEAIKILEDCERAFREHNRTDLAIRTKVTLAMRYANKGKLKKAKILLQDAEKENKYDCLQYYFLNNFAMIDILEHNFHDTLEKNLKDALLLQPTHYEKGIILCNLLIYYCETSKLCEAKEIAKQLEDIDFYQYAFEQYNHILHYNLYYFYSIINDNTYKQKHFLELKKLYQYAPIDLQEYMDATIFASKELPTSHRRYFYSKYPYRPDYIGYWQLEAPDFSSIYVKNLESND